MTLDASQIIFQDKFRVTDNIYVRHSTIGDILDIGEQRYFQILHVLTGIPSDEKWILHQSGIDWMEITDLQYFAMVAPTLKKEDVGIFLPGLDFKRFKLYKRPDGDFVYSDAENGYTIDFRGHKIISDCLCTIHRIKKKVEKAGNAYTKQMLIKEDEQRHKLAMAKQSEFHSTLMPLISSMINREGFKYDYSSIRGMLFGQFMDAVARLQLIVATDQLVQGIYAGNVDAKKIKKKNLDWTREI